MKRIVAFAIATSLALGSADPATAQSAKIEDLHCLIALGAVRAQAEQSEQKDMAVLGSMYFLGKVVAASPEIDLPAELAREAAKLNGQPVQALLQRCAQELNTRSQQLANSSTRAEAPPGR